MNARFISLFAVFAAAIAAAPSADQFDDIIRRQIGALSKAAGFPIKAVVKNTSTEVEGVSTIVLSEQQLRAIFRRANVKQFNQAVGLIMAHEAGHLAQKLLYGAEFYTKDKSKQRVFECQADILAGKYLVESFPTISDRTATPSRLGSVIDALSLLYAVGSQDDRVFAGHPRPDERRECVRLGMAAGQVVVMSNDPQFGPASAADIAQKIDWFPAPMPWSLDRALHILHFPETVVGHIELEQHAIRYDTNPDNPIAQYSLTYRNRTRNKLVVDMDVQCIAVPRNNPRDTSHTELISSRHYVFTLVPGERHTIEDTIPWNEPNLNLPTLMPRLSFPPEDGSLITVRASQ